MDGPTGTTTYASSRYRAAKSAIYVVCAVLLVAMLTSMAKRATTVTEVYMVIVAAAALVLLFGAARAARCGFVVDDDGVTAKMVFSTKRFALAQIDHAETVDRLARSTPLGVSFVRVTRAAPEDPRTQVLPVLWLKSGRAVALHSLRVTTRDRFAPNWVDEAIHDVNARLMARRGPMPS